MPILPLWEGGEHEAVTTGRAVAFRLLKALVSGSKRGVFFFV